MLRALAEAGAALQRQDYIQAALRNAAFILGEMSDERGRLHRSWKEGRATLNGYLEDYTVVAEGLIALYQITFDRRWLDDAARLLGMVHDHFWDEDTGAAFHTSDDHEQLIVRRKDFFDNAEPSGNSAYATAALRLARLTDQSEYVERAETVFRFMRHPMVTQPSGFGHLLCALDFYLRPSREVVITGPHLDSHTQALRQVVYARYLPDTVVTGFDPAQSQAEDGELPIHEGRELVNGQPAAYVCRNYTCRLPVTNPEALAAQLEGET